MSDKPLPPRLANRHVTLCITGSIAAYKAVVLLRLLLKEGATVDVVLTKGAAHFVGPATLGGLTGRPVLGDMFDAGLGGELHVELGEKTDLLLVVPTSADTIARLATGRADDLTGALALCSVCPIVLAPAMHPRMWMNVATQQNVAKLGRDERFTLVGPVVGQVANGEVGMGRMAEPQAILEHALSRLAPAPLRGRHIVVTAGPTAEDIDPVRTLSNRSSGKMGFALAERAALLGARVTLIAGPVALPTPAQVQRIDVRSAAQMRAVLWQVLHPDLSGADALIMAAAVADYRPAQPSAKKLKSGEAGLSLELVPNPDLLAEIGRARQGRQPVLVGFALETEAEPAAIASARRKLADKRVDLVVANRAEETLEQDAIRALLVDARDCRIIERTSKPEAAGKILEFVAKTLDKP